MSESQNIEYKESLQDKTFDSQELFDLSRFDEYREDNRREVKTAQEKLPFSLWDTYSSFANTYGGVIILGVKERKDGSWITTGLKNQAQQKRQFWDIINNPSKVSVNLLKEKDIQTYIKGDDVIMVIHVPAARREDKPVYINNDMLRGTFRRNGEGDYRCSKSEVLAMLRDQTEETSDMKVLSRFSIGDLNMDTVHSYRNRHTAYRSGHVWDNLSDEDYLERIGATKYSEDDRRVHPTAAGLLMFGEEYKILYEFPEYFLDYREMLDPAIRWTDRVQSSSGDWTGNLFDFFFRVYPKLTKDLKIPFRLEGITRIDDTPVHKSIREALANCLVNTDFFVPRGVVIRKDADRIIMENPGYIRTGKGQMLKGGISDPRNKALMKMFNMIGIGERAGSGVPDIFATWEAQGWEEPLVEEQYGPDRTILTLSFEKKEGETTRKTTQKTTQKKTRDRLLDMMKEDPEITQETLAKQLRISMDGVKYHIKKLRQEKLIERIGGDKGGRWEVKE